MVQYDYGLARDISNLSRDASNEALKRDQIYQNNQRANAQQSFGMQQGVQKLLQDQQRLYQGQERLAQGQERLNQSRNQAEQKAQQYLIEAGGMTADILGSLANAPDKDSFIKQRDYTLNLPVVKMLNKTGEITDLVQDQDRLKEIQPLLANLSATVKGKAPLYEKAVRMEKITEELAKYSSKKDIDLVKDPEIARAKAEATQDFKRQQGTSITLPDGTQITQGGYITPQGNIQQQLNRSVQSDVQKGLINDVGTQGDIQAIEESFSPDLLTHQGKLYSSVNTYLDKLGLPSDQQNIQDRTNFENNVDQFFNAYRKEITGAAAAEQELKRLEQSILNKNMSPTQFKSALEQMKSKTNRMMRVKRKLLREGINIGSQDFGQQFDAFYYAGADDDPKDRIKDLQSEFLKKYPNDRTKAMQEVVKVLEKEGYAI